MDLTIRYYHHHRDRCSAKELVDGHLDVYISGLKTSEGTGMQVHFEELGFEVSRHGISSEQPRYCWS